MQFSSDNWAGAAPRIREAMGHAGEGMVPAYGNAPIDQAVTQMLAGIFECDVSVFLVGTGTAANSLAIAASSKPGGVAFCHREAHVYQDECGAPEFYSGGRLIPVDGDLGRIDPAALQGNLNGFPEGFVHGGRPTAVTITQASELGTIYTPDEIARISAIARSRQLHLHMDGARFANALVSSGASPAELTWKAGVDMLSFGATKNGCWCAEALILFDQQLATDTDFLRKRAGHLFSKSRFISEQFLAYLSDGYWLELARQANAMASLLGDAVNSARRARLAWKPQANIVFAVMEQDEAERLMKAGAGFHPWKTPAFMAGELGETESIYRLVTSFATCREDVECFAELLAS